MIITYTVKAGRDVTVLRDGNIVWTSQKPLTTATN